MAAEFGQSEDVWQSGISCGGGWFGNFVTYARVNPEALAGDQIS